MKKYVVVDLKSGLYYGAYPYGWVDAIYLAELFHSKDGAERLVIGESIGYYRIDKIYINED